MAHAHPCSTAVEANLRTARPGSRLHVPLLVAALLSRAAAAAAEPSPDAVATVDFGREVYPLLAQRCFECHGPAKQRAELRLDSRDAALRGGKSGPALQPGKGESSRLFIRIAGLNGEDVMPPKGERLTAEQQALVRAWIDQGAPWPAGIGASSGEVRKHWAYVKPVRPEPPPVREGGRVRNDIDRFILARLQTEGLEASPPADRATLIRRLTLDLTGLPPTPAEVEAFRLDGRPNAYEQLVDRLLASPHYGERWARPWLDLARYADTNGYEADYRRSNWPYRDWVIAALNRDLPFDQFTIEQLAGDLLPEATTDQKVATGFHRNTMTNTEGGTDDEEFRTAAVIDRVNTTYTVWQGTTMACAQCHNHKYDPFTQREYYQAFAYFNQTRDGGKTLDPVLELPSPEQARQRTELRAKIQPLQAILDTQTPALDTEQAQWEAKLDQHYRAIAGGWAILEPAEFSASNGVQLERQPDQSLFASVAKPPETSVYEFVVRSPLAGLTAFRVEALTDERLPQHSSGWSRDGEFVLTDFSVELRPATDVTTTNESPRVEFDLAYADFADDRFEAGRAIDRDPKSGWAVGADQERNRTNRFAVFVAKAPVTPVPGSILVLRLKQESIRPQNLLGRFRLAVSAAPREAHQAWANVPPPIRPLLTRPSADRTAGDQAELAKYHRSIAPSLDPTRAEIAELRKQEPKDIPTTLVLEAVKEPRATHVFKRGSFLDPGEEVQPGVPFVLATPGTAAPRDRLEFARWLVSPDNPLTARVTMNRIWAAYFGHGLVATSEDFGSQGEPPTHPELLDWLATEFVRQGWSLKAMHRLIVNSATYRQSARLTPASLEHDANNRWLARGPRFRMEAEMLRDTALAAGGLLNPAIVGPSVFPYQPDGVWAMPYSDDKWVTQTNGSQFRRGLYTFARRSFPYAAFVTFDAPSREVCVERRPRTNTPLQALTTLNDPAFVAAAAGLARRVLDEGGETPRQRLNYAFRCVVSRKPGVEERQALLELHRRLHARFTDDAAAAQKVATAALPLGNPRADLADLATWTVIANVLLNLDEALTKG